MGSRVGSSSFANLCSVAFLFATICWFVVGVLVVGIVFFVVGLVQKTPSGRSFGGSSFTTGDFLGHRFRRLPSRPTLYGSSGVSWAKSSGSQKHRKKGRREIFSQKTSNAGLNWE